MNFRFEQMFESIDALRKDIEELKVNLGKFDPQIGFCHNDLAHTNLIYNKEEGKCVSLRERETF